MKKLELSVSIPFKAYYDVIVAGGGVAGVAAALAARRSGKKVLIIEKSNLLGGLATIGLINLFVPLCNGRGKQIIFGMAEEFLKLAIRSGFDTLPAEWRNGEPVKSTKKRYVTKFSANIFALELTNLLIEEGVEILFDCVVSRPVMKDCHCAGVITESKSGPEFFEAGIVIDTTGDADILYRAGVPTVQGKNFFTYYAFMADLDSCANAVKKGSIKELYKNISVGKADLYGVNHPVNMPFFSGTNVEDITNYIITSQRKMLAKISTFERNSREILSLPSMPQFRTTRRIDGDYTLTTDDVYHHFYDSIGTINDFERRDHVFEVPLRAMTRSGYDNLITAGRTVAGDGYAWDILRVIPPAILTGQAAGIASSLALDLKMPIHSIDIGLLQQKLAKDGIMIHFDDTLIPSKNIDSGEHVNDMGHI